MAEREPSIRLSEKHGVNPSMGVCFFCGEDDGTIALVGRLPGDKEAPRRACFSLEPCEKCQKKAKEEDFVFFVEMDATGPKGQMAPTGRYVGVKAEVVRRLINPPELREAILAKRQALIASEDWRQMGLPT